MDRLALVLAALLCLSACASPTDVRGGKTDIDVMTDIPAERVAGCAGDKLEPLTGGLSSTRLTSRPTSNGYSVVVDQPNGLWGGADTLFVVDIVKVDNKTHVTMFDHALMGESKWIALVRSCL